MVSGTEIPFSVQGKDIILMDDVLYTGRTMRAALDALFDHGRPARVQLLALIDRGHRELPIEARFVGRMVQTTDNEIIEVKFQEIDGMEKVLLVERVAASEAVRTHMPAGLLGIEELDRAEIEAILARAKDFQPMQSQPLKKLDTLRGKMIVNLFFEASTRTRTSFEIAAKRLGADAVSITAVGLQRLQGRIAGGYAEHAGGHAAGRHRDAPRGLRRAAFSGAAPADAHHQRRRRHARAPHAGAARRAHDSRPPRHRSKGCGWPSSATSRTAAWRAPTSTCCRSSAWTSCCAVRRPLLPPELAQHRARACTLTNDIDEAIRDADVIMMLRVQLERQHEAAFPASEYFRFYGLRLEHLELARPDVHRDASRAHQPRPRAFLARWPTSQRSVILNQVENGIAVRMAVLERVIG